MSTHVIKVSDGYLVNGKHVFAYGKHVPADGLLILDAEEKARLMDFIRSIEKLKLQSTIKERRPS